MFTYCKINHAGAPGLHEVHSVRLHKCKEAYATDSCSYQQYPWKLHPGGVEWKVTGQRQSSEQQLNGWIIRMLTPLEAVSHTEPHWDKTAHLTCIMKDKQAPLSSRKHEGSSVELAALRQIQEAASCQKRDPDYKNLAPG